MVEQVEELTVEEKEAALVKSVEEKKELEKPAYDKMQQQIDQERANSKRARESNDQLGNKLTSLESDLASTKELLQKTTEQLNRPVVADPDEMGVTDVAKYAQGLEKQVSDLKLQHDDLQKRQEATDEKTRQENVSKQVQAAQDRILTDCDDEYGAEHRNEALKLADELVDKGDIQKPTTEYDGGRLMRRCYKDTAAKHKDEHKPKTPTDAGGGNVAHENKLKPGSIKDVLKQMKNDPSTWKGPG